MIREASAAVCRQNLGEMLNPVQYRHDSILNPSGWQAGGGPGGCAAVSKESPPEGPLRWPLQLLEPAWQWLFSNALINGAFLPLLALALLP